jgi:hypothetical protein
MSAPIRQRGDGARGAAMEVVEHETARERVEFLRDWRAAGGYAVAPLARLLGSVLSDAEERYLLRDRTRGA